MTNLVSDHLLEVHRPEWPAFKSTHGVDRDKIPPMQPTSEVRSGAFSVRGYGGGTKEDHMQHLIFMATLALPELAKRWNTPLGASLRATPTK